MQFFIIGFLICFDIALAIFAWSAALQKSATGSSGGAWSVLWPSAVAGVVGGVILFALASAIAGLLGAELMRPDWRGLAVSFIAAAMAGFVLSLIYHVITIHADGGDRPIEMLFATYWSTLLIGLYGGTLVYLTLPIWSRFL